MLVQDGTITEVEVGTDPSAELNDIENAWPNWKRNGQSEKALVILKAGKSSTGKLKKARITRTSFDER